MQVNSIKNSNHSPSFKGVTIYKVLKKDLVDFRLAIEPKIVPGKGILVYENPYFNRYRKFCSELNHGDWARQNLKLKGTKVKEPLKDDSVISVFLFTGKDIRKAYEGLLNKSFEKVSGWLMEARFKLHDLRAGLNPELKSDLNWDKTRVLAADRRYDRYQKMFDKLLKEINAKPVEVEYKSKGYADLLKGLDEIT